MATSAGPYAVALGTVLNLTPNQASGVYFSTVQIVNSSPFLGTVMIGGNQYVLQPFSADLFPVPQGGQSIPITFSQALGGSATPMGASFCTTTWYSPSDQITDSYPYSLTSAAVLATISLPASQSIGNVWSLAANGSLAATQFGPVTPVNVKWLFLSVCVAAATVTVAGYTRVGVSLAAATTTLLNITIPWETTFIPFSQTITFAYPLGGVTAPAAAGGVFVISGSRDVGTVTANVSSIEAYVGY